MNEINEDKLNRAWDAVLDQYFDFCVKNTRECGPGINMFYVKHKINDKGDNCDYFYCKKDDEYWNSIMDVFDDKILLDRVYNPDDHIIICVQLQHIEEAYEYGGTIRLFNFSKNEVNIYSPRYENIITKTATKLRKRF